MRQSPHYFYTGVFVRSFVRSCIQLPLAWFSVGETAEFYTRLQQPWAMENTSLSSDVGNNSSKDDDPTTTLALKVVWIVVGTVGVVDNLFVIIVFALFININDKV